MKWNTTACDFRLSEERLKEKVLKEINEKHPTHTVIEWKTTKDSHATCVTCYYEVGE